MQEGNTLQQLRRHGTESLTSARVCWERHVTSQVPTIKRRRTTDNDVIEATAKKRMVSCGTFGRAAIVSFQGAYECSRAPVRTSIRISLSYSQKGFTVERNSHKYAAKLNIKTADHSVSTVGKDTVHEQLTSYVGLERLSKYLLCFSGSSCKSSLSHSSSEPSSVPTTCIAPGFFM